MLKKTMLLAVTIIWLALPVNSMAQEAPPGKWWHMPKIEETLNLSNEEKQTLDDLYLENRRKLIALKAALETEQLELEALIDRESLDEPAIMTQFKRLQEARTKLGSETFRYILQVRKTIGRERFQEIKSLKRKMYRGKNRHSPGFRRHNREPDAP